MRLTPLGKVKLDKMHERIDVFALAPDGRHASARLAWRRSRRWVIALVLLVVIGGGSYAAWLALASPETAATPRLAVLRFETLGDTEPYFNETLADELIAYASRMEGLDVIARASSFRLEGHDATPQGAARDLNATLVLTGSVRRLDDRVLVTAQLVEAPSARQVWSEEFDRPLDEIYLLQNEIAARVAVAAGLRATPPAGRRVDPQAYELYVRGREASLRDHQAAAALYEQAVARDAQFAAAWSYLAWSQQLDAWRRWEAASPGAPIDPSWFEPALAAADRAIALDPDAPLPYEVRSRAFRYLGRWQDSLEASERAIERGGGSAAVYASLGYLRRAKTIARRGVERDPLSSLWWRSLGQYCRIDRDLPCAVEAFERAHRLAPNEPPYDLALALRRIGRSAEARELARQHQQAWREFFGPRTSPIDMQLFRAMLGEGAAPSSADLLASLERGANFGDVVTVLAELNRGDDAAQALSYWTAAARPALMLLYDSPLAPMRARPEFWLVMEREGIARLWRESGEWPDFCVRERSVCDQHIRRGRT